MNINGKKVEIYSTPSCHFCHMAKEFFTEHHIAFTDYDVASDISKREEMMDKSGQLGVPVIVIDDQDVVIGFDQRRLTDLLGVAV
ncbi:glutathione S-transferase N-terminal domain-containing protein [Candidatus Parcubacteria bacterium]|nr:glutathione S-transferase N-terminal domain-containing protein [Candidatus Parcubacteria bacterium]